MAEGAAAEGGSPLRRSVSFQRLQSGTGPEGGGGPRGAPRQAQPPSARAQQQQQQPEPEPSRAASLGGPRSVAKLAAASPGPEPPPPGSRSLRSLSPSVRQLSRRFCAPRGRDDEPGEAARGRAPCGGRTEPDAEPARGEPPPVRGKGPSEPAKGGGEAALDWPSVTEMRKLFGESFRRPEPRGEPQEDGPALRGAPGKGREPAPPAPGSPPHLPGTDGSDATPCLLLPPEGAAPGRRGEARAVHEERREAPPPPPRSCIPFPGLRGHRLPRASAERPLPPPPPLWDGLHSWHSAPSRPPAAPSSPASSSSSSAACGFPRGEVFSSSEEELPQPTVLCPGDAASQHAAASSSSSGTAGTNWHKSPQGSSGSEEEDHLVTPRRRSCRKKKKNPQGLQEPSADTGGQAGMEWHRRAQEDLCQNFLLPAEDRTRPPPEAKAWPPDRTAAHLPVGTVEGHWPFARGLSEGSASLPGSHGPLPSASPLSLVSRVSKVNIPPFGSSPCGSRSSSRYSSTETLKEEEQSGPSWAAQGRGFQGGLGLFRSPSFGQSDPLARLQPPVRTRPKLPWGMVKKAQDLSPFAGLQHCGPEAAEKSRHRKSMSNPDIATETLTLLNFLKSDLSELRARKKGARAGDPEEAAFGSCSSNRHESYYPSTAGPPTVSRTQSEVHPPNRWAVGSRPSLKDLTATLRRAKSFTYSDKAAPRRLFHPSALKQSSSELLLATARHHDGSVSDSEISRRGEDDGLPVVIQDQYIQEARQVFEKIRRMGSQQDDSFALEQKSDGSATSPLSGDREAAEPLEQEEAAGGSGGQRLRQTNSEGNLSGGKSLEELSGPESTMTDEGIVTEPEAGLAYSYLNPSVEAWKSGNQRESEANQTERKEVLVPSYAAREKAALADETLPNTKAGPQGLLEAPSTPGAVRRRRKFPSVGNNGSESSNGSNGESNGDTYRSLSDPMPHRKCSISEDSQNFSVDSNLLGSLNSKSGLPESSAVALSECTGSAASDLSVCSDGVKDYSTVIQNIVSQPGALDKVIDEKGNGKTIKKKSFSDPSRRGELASAGFDGPGEPINEMDQSIPPSSSEPILSEPRDPTRGREQEVGQLYSQSEHVLPAPPEGDMAEVAQNYGFDPKLAEVLSPRIVRRSSKKRSNRVSCQENRTEDATPASTAPDTLSRARPATKHVRHTSEPATFIPVSKATLPTGLNRNTHIATPEPSRLSMKPYPVVQAPSLEDVTKHYMLALGSGELSPRALWIPPDPHLPRQPLQNPGCPGVRSIMKSTAPAGARHKW